MSAPVRGGGWLLLLLTFTLLAAFPYAEATRNANERPRLLQGIALAERGEWSIDGVAALYNLSLGPDIARDPESGRIYPNKPPGASVVAAAAFAITRALHPRPTLRLYTWWARLLGAALPTLLLVAFLWRRFAAQLGPRPLAVALYFYVWATPAAAYAHLLYGHQLAACALTVGALLLIDSVRAGRSAHAALAGLLTALAVTVEYTAAFAALPIAAWLLIHSARALRPARHQTSAPTDASRPTRPLSAPLAALAGALAPILALAAYHTHAFGGPLHTGYHHVLDPTFAALHGQGLLGLGAPRWGAFYAQILAPGAGLLFWAPLTLVGALGLALGARSDPHHRPHRALLLALFLLFIALAAGLSFTGGWRVGPRYLVAVMPGAALGLAWLLAARGRHLPVLGVISFLGAAATAANALAADLWPHFDLDAVNAPVAEVLLPLWRAGYRAYDPLQLFFEVATPLARLAIPTTVLAGLALLLALDRRRSAALTVLLGAALGLTAVLASASLPPHARAAANLRYIERVWEPPLAGPDATSAPLTPRAKESRSPAPRKRAP